MKCKAYIGIGNIRGPAEEIEYWLGDVGCDILARIGGQLAAVKNTQVRNSVVVGSGGISLETAAALAPDADAGRVNVLPVALSGIGVNPVDGCGQGGRVLPDQSVPRGRLVCVGVDVSFGIDKGGTGGDG